MRVSRRTRIIVDQRGKIKTGYKGADGFPKKAGHFILKHPVTEEILFPELIEAYGEKPDRMVICFGSDLLEDVFNDDYNLWNKANTKTRTCNGELCTHVLNETIQGCKYAAGTQTECVCQHHNLFETDDKELKKLACKCDMYLKAYIFSPKTKKIINPLPYLFSCHSTNSADNIYSMLSRVKNLQGIPFELFLKKVTKNNLSFYIWNIIPVIIPENLLEYTMDRLPEASIPSSTAVQHEDEIVDEDEPEENVDKETGEVIESGTLFNGNYEHLQGHVKRIERCTFAKDVDEAFAVMLKINGLKKEDKEYLLKAVAKQKEFIRAVSERERT